MALMYDFLREKQAKQDRYGPRGPLLKEGNSVAIVVKRDAVL